jgi:hypothetical protein
MASGILKRTALVDNSKGYPIYHDYCLVETSLGSAVEFNPPLQRGDIGGSVFNPGNEAYKIDEVVSLSADQRPAIMKDEALGILLQETSNYNAGY